MQLFQDVMWQAVLQSSNEYDGRFFYGVKTVGVYCHPSCKSKAPLRKNVRYFSSIEEAETAGFRPCKRCRPDLGIFSPKQELVKQGIDLADRHFKNRKELFSALQNLGVSRGHISTVFKMQLGITFSAYVRQQRLFYAQQQLLDTSVPIASIAEDLEFSSLAAFYAFFHKHMGIAPKMYRTAASPENS